MWEGETGTRRRGDAGLCLITRVRQRECSWILKLRFEPYVNPTPVEGPEE